MKKNKNTRVILFCMLCIFISLFFVAKANAKELQTLKIYYQPVIASAPIIIGDEEGFFKEEGINLEWVKARDMAEALILLLQGSIDVIYSPLSAGVYTAVKEGKNIKLIASVTYHTKGNKFAGLAVNSPDADTNKVFDIKSLKGKKIGVPALASVLHYCTEVFLQRNEVSINDVELIPMPVPLIMKAIEQGTLDAGHLTEPFLTTLNSRKKIYFFSIEDEFPDMPGGFLIYGQKLLVKNPELGIKFMVAYLKGWEKYKEGKTVRNIEILEKRFEMDKELLKKMYWPIINPDGIYKTKILKDYQDWLLEKNYIKEKINIDSLIDLKFLKKAKGILQDIKGK